MKKIFDRNLTVEFRLPQLPVFYRKKNNLFFTVWRSSFWISVHPTTPENASCDLCVPFQRR